MSESMQKISASKCAWRFGFSCIHLLQPTSHHCKRICINPHQSLSLPQAYQIWLLLVQLFHFWKRQGCCGHNSHHQLRVPETPHGRRRRRRHACLCCSSSRFSLKKKLLVQESSLVGLGFMRQLGVRVETGGISMGTILGRFQSGSSRFIQLIPNKLNLARETVVRWNPFRGEQPQFAMTHFSWHPETKLFLPALRMPAHTQFNLYLLHTDLGAICRGN